MLDSLYGMEPVDYARYVCITLAFLVATFSNEKAFLRTDVTFCVAMGIGWAVFPNVFLDFQVSGPRNEAHVLYARALGVGFISAAAPILLNKRTGDDKVFTSIYLSRLLGFTMMLIGLFYTHWKFAKSAIHLTDRQFWFAGLAIMGWVAGNLRHLLVSGGSENSSERAVPNRLWYHLFCDVIFMLPASLYLMAFGSQVYVDLTIKVSGDDGFLAFVSYSMGAFAVSDCLFVLSAHSFDDTNAVKNVFKFRLMMVVIYTVMQVAHGLIKTNALIMMLVTYAALSINCLLALRYINAMTD